MRHCAICNVGDFLHVGALGGLQVAQVVSCTTSDNHLEQSSPSSVMLLLAAI